MMIAQLIRMIKRLPTTKKTKTNHGKAKPMLFKQNESTTRCGAREIHLEAQTENQAAEVTNSIKNLSYLRHFSGSSSICR
jgi:hypothetical protein